MPDRFSSQVDEQLAETLEKMRADGMESRAVVSSESSYILNEIMRSRNKDDLKDRLARMVGDRAAGAYAELADTIPEGERRNAARIFAETAAVYEDLAYRVPDPAARDRARRVALDLAVNEVRTYAEAIDRNDRLVLHSEKLDERISPQERDRLMAENWRDAHRELEDMTIAASNAAGDKDMDAWAAEYRHQIASAIGEDIAQVYFRMIPGASYETAYTEIRYARLKAAWIMERYQEYRNWTEAEKEAVLRNAALSAVTDRALAEDRRLTGYIAEQEEKLTPAERTAVRDRGLEKAEQALEEWRALTSEEAFDREHGDLYPDLYFEKKQLLQVLSKSFGEGPAGELVAVLPRTEWENGVRLMFGTAERTRAALEVPYRGKESASAEERENKELYISGVCRNRVKKVLYKYAAEKGYGDPARDPAMDGKTLRRVMDLAAENMDAYRGIIASKVRDYCQIRDKPLSAWETMLSQEQRDRITKEILDAAHLDEEQKRAFLKTFSGRTLEGLTALSVAEAKIGTVLKTEKDLSPGIARAFYREIMNSELQLPTLRRWDKPYYEDCFGYEAEQTRDRKLAGLKKEYPGLFDKGPEGVKALKSKGKDRNIMETRENAQDKKGMNVQAEKKRMEYSSRPALYAETTDMIKDLAAQVLKEKTFEPVVAHFQRTVNPISRHSFRAVNTILLTKKARERGYNDDRWVTFNQAANYGLHLKKGEKGVLVTHFGIATQEEVDKRKKATLDWNRSHPDQAPKEVTLKPGDRMTRDYFVFNAEQFSSFPKKDPEYTREEQAKILTKIHEVAAPGVDLPENTSPREILQEGISHVVFGEDSPAEGLTVSEIKAVAEIASGMLHKELDIRSPLVSGGYESYIARDDEMDHEAFDRLRERPTQLAAYLNLAERVVDQVKDRVIGREMLHQEIAFSDRMKTVEKDFGKDERREYAVARQAGLTPYEIKTYMKPEIREKWETYREKFLTVKDSAEKSMKYLRDHMTITPGKDENTVTVEAPRTLLDKIRRAQKNVTKAVDPADRLPGFSVGQTMFSFQMNAGEKDPLFAACGHRYDVQYQLKTAFRERKVNDLKKAIEKDIQNAKAPEKAKAKERAADRGLSR